jgi:hypothetical protein
MTEDHKAYAVGEIRNYYGSLKIKREKGVDYWSIEDWDGHRWQAIPDALGDAIRTTFPQGDDR